ncbi:MAG: helix-turn-helix domain-containing protein [Alphaproteobacteria bacterium]
MAHPVDVYVGQRLRQRRELSGMPQKELARKLGISFQQVQKYESGANRISASKLWELCCVLDVAPGYFFDGISGATTPAGEKSLPEGEVGDYQSDPRSARQILDLNHNFQRIPNTRVRRQVVQLVKALVD